MKKYKTHFLIFLMPVMVWGTYRVFPEFAQRESKELETISPASTSDTSVVALKYELKNGYRYVYSFERRLSIHGMAQMPEISYQGNFYLDVINKKKNSWNILFHADLSTCDGNPQESMRAQLDPLFTSLKIFRDPSLENSDGQQRNLLRDLMSVWSFPYSEDATARYVSMVSRESENHWKKLKSKYLIADAPEIVKSEHFLSLDEAEHVPFELSGQEETRLGAGSQSLSSVSSYKMRLVRIEPLNGKLDSKKWTEQDSLALEIITQQKMTPQQLAELWKVSIKELENLNSLTPNEQLRLFGDLAKLLLADSSYGNKLVSLLSQKDLQLGAASALLKLVVGTLATVGGEASERALVEIYRQTISSGQGTILAAMASTEATLSSLTGRFLLQEMRVHEGTDLGWGAAFAYGSSLRGRNVSASELNVVLDGFENAKRKNDFEALIDWMDVMGNSGKAEFVPILVQQSASAGLDSVKAKAIYALRFIDREDARSELIKNLHSEIELSREAAARAIQVASWNVVFLPALMDCKTKEIKDSIKEVCMETLDQHLEQVSYNGK